VSARFEELDWRETPIGAISLRRRRDPQSGDDVFEVKLDEDFLMSSQFTVAEVEVARIALAELPDQPLVVAVGGLGLGYTAPAVLHDARVQALLVVEALGAVIEWHELGLIPVGADLTADHRCRFVRGDFFAMVEGPGLDPFTAGRRFHAIIVDIDHSPRHLLHPSHAGFYEPAGIARLAEHLYPGGVFTLWSNDPPDEDYLARLAETFTGVRAEVVRFFNPLQEREATNTVYVAKTAAT
jgi:spermidine synthase